MIKRIHKLTKSFYLNEAVIIQFGRYVAMGGAAFMVEFAIIYLLHELGGLGIGRSAIFSSIIGFIVSFNLQQFGTFSGRAFYGPAFLRYAALACVNLVMATAIIVLLDVILDWKLAKTISALIMAAWNFLVYRRFVFKSRGIPKVEQRIYSDKGIPGTNKNAN